MRQTERIIISVERRLVFAQDRGSTNRAMKHLIVLTLAWAVCWSEARSPPLIKTCPDGYELSMNTISGKMECNCLPYHLYWPLDGLCYRELTQGPCQTGYKLVWNIELEQAECQCPPFWNRADDGLCYEEYTQGPCSVGQLFIESDCVCNPNMTMHFYQETEQCFQLYTQGPCSLGQMFTFNYRSRKPQCVCRDGHVKWTDTNCYEVNTAGPCDAAACPEVNAVFYISNWRSRATN